MLAISGCPLASALFYLRPGNRLDRAIVILSGPSPNLLQPGVVERSQAPFLDRSSESGHQLKLLLIGQLEGCLEKLLDGRIHLSSLPGSFKGQEVARDFDAVLSPSPGVRSREGASGNQGVYLYRPFCDGYHSRINSAGGGLRRGTIQGLRQ